VAGLHCVGYSPTYILMDSTLDHLLNAYWLRPETALWRHLDIHAMDGFAYESPSMDFGAGDGVFSFIRAGGAFDTSFDVFQVTANLDKFYDGADVYDAYAEGVSPLITKRPAYQIDVAFDHKDSLLKKAATLGLYRDFRIGDGNHRLPFAAATFASIFSNIVYWLDDPQSVLRELARVLKPGGQICLMLPDRSLPEFSFYNSLYVKTGDKKWAFLEQLDRGRFADNIRQSKPAEEWERLFENAGLKVEKHARHLSKPVIQLWDIGLRPMFPVLMKMVAGLRKEAVPEIKGQWVAICKKFLEPLVAIDRVHSAHAFHCYVLGKQ
jgi:SAM-dependent methyltransferase